jgi:GPH family glycoside/pentoside/hexuronide:cation symporter
MTETAHHATAPEDRIPFLKKVAYGSGAFVNNTLAAAIGGMMIVLNLGPGHESRARRSTRRVTAAD